MKILLFTKEITPNIEEVNSRQEIPLAHAIKSNNAGIGIWFLMVFLVWHSLTLSLSLSFYVP